MFNEIEQHRQALLRYIESAYHLSDEDLLRQREVLLNEKGTIAQRPYLESAAKYKLGKKFAKLDIPSEVANGLTQLAKSGLLFDPPYLHQSDALETVLTQRKNIIVTTGTGSGKTECFLLPILGRLIAESKASFRQRAVRALLLYPMNALVNDQLGRLRRLFASVPCYKLFKDKTSRPVKFGRYTGRTLFSGYIPTEDNNFSEKIKNKLAGLQFFCNLADRALNHEDEKEKKKVNDVIQKLIEKGRFPAKYSSPDKAAQEFISWYGSSGDRWLTNGKLARTVERPNDTELLLRHEMQNNPPDILVTNYSMLEYMLLRPMEREIFTKTKTYFEKTPDERFILVLDESHLYTGAQGTEVAMLIRRLKHRLNLRTEQFQVICTSASFGESKSARQFAAELSGVPLDSVVAITSEDRKVPQLPSGVGTQDEADWLMNCSIDDIRKDESARQSVSEKLQTLPVFGRLANLTSLTKADDDALTSENTEAPQELESLAEKLFGSISNAKEATDKLVELASLSKDNDGNPLFAARVHRFYRGLSGLYMCANENCKKLYASPHRNCQCGGKVFELYSCKDCGTTYFYAYTNDNVNPQYLWAEDCRQVDGIAGVIKPLHILLNEPLDFDCKKYKEKYLNVITGTLTDVPLKDKTRPVWIPVIADNKLLFTHCPICKSHGKHIGNHQTKGDMPFQQMIASQLLEQPEQPQSDTPLKGRKVLIFSDGRQAASRLAGKLTTDSMRDAIRPLIIAGYNYLQNKFYDSETLSLRYVYAALLAGAFYHKITLSPLLLLKEGEQFHEHFRKICENLSKQNITWKTFRKNVESFNSIPESVLAAVYETLFNENSGYHALTLARVVPDADNYESDVWNDLPVPATVHESDAEQWKHNLIDIWIQLMISKKSVRLNATPNSWIDDDSKRFPKRDDGGFITVLEHILQDKPFVKKNFSQAKNNTPKWLNYFRSVWGIDETANGFFLDGNKLTFQDGGDSKWLRCNVCTAVFPFNPLVERCCPFCQSKDSVVKTDAKDIATSKRIQVYREATDRMNATGKVPYPFVAKEHTAAIGVTSNNEDAFTLAEKYEIRFQDIRMPDDKDKENSIPVDVLSCTTTMEVGIDIGSLTAVAMRNVPPNRANYQQRAGRAGRRGAALSTLLTYADQDSHNQRYFTEPAAMIGGPVKNPILNIDNEQIVKRHLFALIFSMFQQERIQGQINPNIFATLGTVHEFQSGDEKSFSYKGLQQWLKGNRETVLTALISVLDGNNAFQNDWIESIPQLLLEELKKKKLDTQIVDEAETEVVNEENAETENTPLDVSKLLDRLFAASLLPSYAFPTDCVAIHVFDKYESQRQRKPVMRYAPQHGLTQALSSYAPGKEVYIDGKRHYSFAIWSPFPNERKEAWQQRKLYYECGVCGHVEMKEFDKSKIGEEIECSGCRQHNTLGPARVWFIPPGFAQPVDMPEELPEFDVPDSSFATHAKLTADFTNHTPLYSDSHFTFWNGKEKLILTNRGVSEEKLSGFHYCEKCGRIEPANWFSDKHTNYSMFAKDEAGQPKYHLKPYPVVKEKDVCETKRSERNIVLGTTFNSDVVLIRLRFGKDINLIPGSHLTRIALGTLATAMSQTAIAELEIAPTNIGGEFRPSATADGQNGKEADVFLYDNVADGAGFVQAATNEPQIFLRQVLRRLENCNCESACPHCLQTYQNRYMHGSLDRQLAAGLLRYLLDGTLPQLDERTEDRLLNILAADLQDKIDAVVKDGYIEVNGKVILIVHSLTNRPATERTKRLYETLSGVIPIDHIKIDRALPAATNCVLDEIR